MMNLDNYNAISSLPTDLITGDIIAFGEEVEQVFDDFLMLTKDVIPNASNNEASP
ncbi:hypothetical protein NST38_30785 [Paenibacillus sp. FSL H8-0104]|uniref:hypothetical protein n=1 Tax=Paenibacillus sp. FSL H8-0104 TaxID=2954509 RepID=UPI0030FD52AD